MPLTDHDCPHFSIVMLQVVDHGWTSTQEKSGLCSAERTGFSHLGLNASALIFLIKMTVVGKNPFGSKAYVVLWSLSLSPSISQLSWLPGHCAQSMSVAISSKLQEAQYTHIPPGGDGGKQHLNIEPWLCTDDWPTTEIFLSTMCPFLILSTSPFNSSLPCKKSWMRMTYPHSLYQVLEWGRFCFFLWWA